MFELEVKYISEFNSFNEGLNTTIGGEGCLGYKHSLGTCEKMSKFQSENNTKKDKTYEEIYGESATLESEKRSIGVKAA